MRVKLILRGATRTVLLIGKYSFKLPCLHHNYAMFIEGIRANLNEGRFVGFKDQAPIAKTLYSNRFGLLNIQERVRPVSHRGLFAAELHTLCAHTFFSKDFIMDDPKPENFGYNKRNVLVKIDYGN